MNKRTRLLLTQTALIAVFVWAPGQAAQPWGTGQVAQPATKDNGHWNEHFKGRGNVTWTRCLGMARGAKCITAADRKAAARRAAAARAAGEGAAAEGAAAPHGTKAGGKSK